MDGQFPIGTACKQVLGKLRHLECHSLWLIQRLRRKEFELCKVAGEENPADLFTKHLEYYTKFDQLMKLFNCTIVSGRAESAPGLKTAKGADDQNGVSFMERQLLPHRWTSGMPRLFRTRRGTARWIKHPRANFVILSCISSNFHQHSHLLCASETQSG